MSRIRQQEKAKLSREKLMAAADELFARQKISEVGVRDIAARAGVTTGTFYHYFTGKDDILDQIYRSRDADMGGMLHDLAQDTDSYCMKIQSFFVDKLAGTVLSDGREFTCYRVFRMRKHSSDENSLYIGMQELIRKAIKAGEFRGDVSAKEINDYLFVVFRGVLYEVISVMFGKNRRKSCLAGLPFLCLKHGICWLASVVIVQQVPVCII